MATNEAKARADAKWHKKAYDRVTVLIRKDDDVNGDFIRQYAESRGESLNGFIKRALIEKIERDKESMF